MNAIMRLHRAQAGYLAAQGSGSKYIKFADPAVEAVLMAKGVSSDGIGITVADAASVTDISTWFRDNKTIESFDEFEKFTGVTYISGVGDSSTASSFYGCSALKSIKLPPSVNTIYTQSFLGCSALEKINLQNENITYIRNEVFKNCTNLSGTIDLPNLEKLGDRVSASVFQNTGISKVASLGKITKLWGHASVKYGVFLNCTKLVSVVLPETLVSISGAVFQGCTALVEINLPSLLEEVNGNAFMGCTALEIDDLALPNLTSLGQNAFYGVKIKKISNLGEITALPTATTSTQNFGNKSVLEEVVLPETLTSIYQYSFYNYTALTKCHIPSSVVSIGEKAFYGSPISSSLNLPNLTTIDSRAFDGSDISEIVSLGNITTLPDGVWFSSQHRGVFSRNKNLSSVVLPKTLTTVGYGAFSYCTSLSEITLPSSITRIGEGSFINTNLSTLVCLATTPPTLENVAFSNTPIASGTGFIYVPDASVADYKAATNWAQYASQIKPMSELNG